MDLSDSYDGEYKRRSGCGPFVRKCKVPMYQNKVCTTTCAYEPVNECEPENKCESTCEAEGAPMVSSMEEHHKSRAERGWDIFMSILVAFIVFTIFYWLIFFSTKPSWVQNADGSVNFNNVLIAAVVSALITLIIFGIIYALIRAFSHCN